MTQIGKAVRLGYLAQVAEGELTGGDPDQQIHGVAEIDSAEAGQITYAVNDQYAQKLHASRAAAVVVPLSLDMDLKKPMIKAENPYWSFAKILEIFSPESPGQEEAIHASAVIHPTASLGEGCQIGPHVTIEANVRIGSGSRLEAGTFVGHGSVLGQECRIFPNVTIRHDSHIGDRVVIQSGTVIGGDGYGFVLKNGSHYKIPQIGNVVLGDDVEIGCNVTIDRATIGQTVLKRGVKVDNLVQIGHNVVVGENTLLVSQVGISGSTHIGANCRFAGQSGAAGHLKVGDGSTIAARGAVTKSLPARSFVSGFPAKPHSQEKRIMASIPKLPALLKRVRQLELELERLTEES